MRARAGAAAVLAAVLVGGGTAASVAVPAGSPGSPASVTTPVSPTPASPTSASATDGTGPSTVTLITGDRVTLTRSQGHPRILGIERGEGREGVGFLQQIENDRLFIIPTDVAYLVPDRLDRALFDVGGLAEAGYAESDPDTVPVIVQATAPGGVATKGAPAASAEPDWAGLGIEPERELESVGAVSAELDADAATDLLAAIQEPPADARTAAGALTAAATPSDLKVWLDSPVQALDADSTPQIGAPAAWDAGYTGEGVTVAVLDTGVDTTHPDLDDVTIGSRDFTGAGTTADGHGHGTHVASIALGSGDASGGVNRGVAPGANLLVGKVLGDGGSGTTSGVIDGMEWAASAGADVVNMSLGESMSYGDGTDPASMAVNTLSARYDTLFVIAAGNDGEYGNGTVGSPALADAALTVGAVDDADDVTAYSSRGPRGGDYALKPDVTAPGDAIVAARAVGTAIGDVVDEYHVTASGTSMAAPHVAGAAAVLKQARPELAGQELKAILMGSAQPTSGTVWDEGAGRIFLPPALGQQVVASPSSLSLGAFGFPQSGSEQRTLTYTNPTAADVTLDLTVDVTGPDGAAAPAEVAALSAASVVVPAQGTATVELTADRTVGPAGRYSGAVTATGRGGGEIRTALGWYKEAAHYDLTVTGIDRDGASHDGEASVVVMNVDDGRLFNEFVQLDGGTWTGRVPAGTYSVVGELWEQDSEGAITALTTAVEPEAEVSADTTVVLDASTAEEVTVATERPAERGDTTLGVYRRDVPSAWANGFTSTVPGDVDVYVTQTGPVVEGGLDFTAGFALSAPTTGEQAPAYTYDLMYVQEGVETVDFTATSDNTAEVQVGYADLGPGADVQSGRSGQVTEGDVWWIYRPRSDRPVAPGTVRTEYLSSGVEWRNYVGRAPDDGSEEVRFDGESRRYAPGEVAREVFGGAVLSTRARGDGLFGTQYEWLDLNIGGWADSSGHGTFSFDVLERLRVWQDGTQVVDAEGSWASLPIPEDGAGYRVVLDAERDRSWWNRSTRLSTEWTFHAAPGGTDIDPVELPVLDVAYDVDGMDLANKAPKRTTATVTVGHQAGSTGGTVVETRLWWSPDDGATWRKADLLRTGAGVYKTHLRVPAGTEHVSLRVEAKDGAGSTIEQTVIRAYGVR